MMTTAYIKCGGCGLTKPHHVGGQCQWCWTVDEGNRVSVRVREIAYLINHVDTSPPGYLTHLRGKVTHELADVAASCGETMPPAYSYEAAMHCPTCTAIRFPVTAHPHYYERYQDWRYAAESGAFANTESAAARIAWDNEGNPVHPVFEDEAPDVPTCDGCLTVLEVDFTRTYEDGVVIDPYSDTVSGFIGGEIVSATCGDFEALGGDLTELMNTTNHADAVRLIETYFAG